MSVSPGPAPHTGPDDLSGGPDPRPSGGSASGPVGIDPAAALGVLGRSWTWILGSAVATLVPGILILVWPDETLHVLAVLIGLYLLVTGVFRFVAAFARGDHGERLTGLLLAVLYVVAGVLCLRNPLQTIATLSLIVGVLWLVSGILTLFTALATRELPHRGVVLGAAVLAIVAGIVVLALPTESARALTRLLGLWLILLGLVEAAVAFAWRAALRRARPAAGPGAPAGPV
ncbi:HdeD family acid-resistance protein [Streptomyces sp. NPDC060000]|uniref:HdeD family acid-resistance protein n=1 Tax=Streptomyces sp. NPDC060000 TaxID=3347031 RepID=UPI003684BF0A